jgi:hypothetical protein
MEAMGASETLVTIYQSSGRDITEDSNIHNHNRDSLEFHTAVS